MPLVGFFYLHEFRVLGAGNVVFVLHEDLSDVGSGSLPKGKQNFIDLLLSFQKLASNGLGALSTRADLASEEVHVELKEGIPVLWSLVAIDSHSGTVGQDTNHFLLVFLED